MKTSSLQYELRITSMNPCSSTRWSLTQFATNLGLSTRRNSTEGMCTIKSIIHQLSDKVAFEFWACMCFWVGGFFWHRSCYSSQLRSPLPAMSELCRYGPWKCKWHTHTNMHTWIAQLSADWDRGIGLSLNSAQCTCGNTSHVHMLYMYMHSAVS